MLDIIIYTIGFTKKSAQDFFTTIRKNKIDKMIDVRLNNVSQLAGFAKKRDMEYFLKEICNCKYEHLPMLAPTKKILDGYKRNQITWDEYERMFSELLKKRSGIIEKYFLSTKERNICLLCSEPTAEKCHRRLVAGFIQRQLKEIRVIHL
jgi:uncharacterized protein (DUF488 family)